MDKDNFLYGDVMDKDIPVCGVCLTFFVINKYKTIFNTCLILQEFNIPIVL